MLLPLLLLQLTALEAYVGLNNGGSTTAETLYCVAWAHDRVLANMVERLKEADASSSRTADKDGNRDGGGDNDGSGAAAWWALYASSLGAVRIAKSVQLIVVRADF